MGVTQDGVPPQPGMGSPPSQVRMVDGVPLSQIRMWGTPGQGTPPQPGMGTPPPARDGLPPWDITAEGVLATRRAICLLRSRRRTVLLFLPTIYALSKLIHHCFGQKCTYINKKSKFVRLNFIYLKLFSNCCSFVPKEIQYVPRSVSQLSPA